MPSAISIEITQKLSDDCWVANVTPDDDKSAEPLPVILVITDGELAAIDFSHMRMEGNKAAKKFITIAELKQIGLGCYMYALDYDDRFPDDLNGAIQELGNVNFSINPYVYVGKGLSLDSMKAPSELPIAFVKPAWIGKDGVCCIVYGDGHAESVPVKGRTCLDIVQELTEQVRDKQNVAVVRRNARAEDQAIAKAYEKEDQAIAKAYEKDANLRLLHAAEDGDADEVEKSLSAGADVNAKAEGGVTPLMIAAIGGHAEIVQLLIKAKADVNAKAEGGVTPLMFAAGSSHPASVQLLIEAKADVNAKAEGGFTPLMAAVDLSAEDIGMQTMLKEHVGIVQLLIKAKADVNAKNKNGETVLAIAANKGLSDVVTLLQDAGAKM